MNDNDLQRLERLGRMKADGTLSEQEFEAAKAKLLAEPSPSAARPSPERSPSTSPASPPAALSATWQYRFDFLSCNGLPHTKSYMEAYKALSFEDKMKLSMNVFAFFFGPFYFAYLGLWRPALSILAGSVVYSIVIDQLDPSPSFQRASWVVPAVVYGMTCIPLYFLKVTQGVDDWNPFVWWSRESR